MKQNTPEITKITDALIYTKDFTQRMELISYYINKWIKSDKTIFLDKKDIPSKGLTGFAWKRKEAFFVNDISHDQNYSSNIDTFIHDDIHALLFYPVYDKEEKDFTGLFISIGRGAHERTEEKMIPLKSGAKTIGVTIKQVNIFIPEKTFSVKDLKLLKNIVPKLTAVKPFESDILHKEASDKKMTKTEEIPQNDNNKDSTVEEKTFIGKMKTLLGLH